MPTLNFFRRTRRDVTETIEGSTVTANGASGQSRYSQIPQLDLWRAVPFTMAPAPERDKVLWRVNGIVRSLDGAIDEGSDKSLDRLILSWVEAWIATVKSEYDEHCGVIKVHRGQAQQLVTEAEGIAAHEREKHNHIRRDYAACRSRLTGEHHELEPAAPADAEPAVEAAPRPAVTDRQDWAEPHLVAGRGWVTLAVVAVLIVIGAMADTIAFHNVLELVLSTESETVAWVMAVGTTSMALVAAASLGIARAIRRRGRYLPKRHRPPWFPLFLSSVVWLGLGFAMFFIRWQNIHIATLLQTSGQQPSSSSHSAVWQALFFLAIYLVSGACTLFEAERLYNPEYTAFKRLRKQFNEQAKVVAKAEAERARAESVRELYDAEIERQGRMRDHAIADRQALGMEAANYARVIMAVQMRDPAKTAVTETGPVPPAIAATFGASPGVGAYLGYGPPPDPAQPPADAS
jgi:hypothetical protein